MKGTASVDTGKLQKSEMIGQDNRVVSSAGGRGVQIGGWIGKI